MKLLANMIELIPILPQDCIRKCQQFPAPRHTNIKFWIDKGFKIDVQASFASTLTEEPCMTGCSVKALVNGGHPSRHRFRLSPREILMVLVIFDEDTVHRQVLNVFQFDMPMHFIGHQA